jgi:hypothetical protein
MMASFKEKAPVNCSSRATELSVSPRTQPCIFYYKLRRKPVRDSGQGPYSALLVFRRRVIGRVRASLGFQSGDPHKKQSLHCEEIRVILTETPGGLETFCDSAEAISELWGSHSTHRQSK